MFSRMKIISSAIACGALAVFTFACSQLSADDVPLTEKPAVQQAVDRDSQRATIQLAQWGGGGSGGGWQGGGASFGGQDWGAYGPYYGDRFGIGLGYRQGYGAYCAPGNYSNGMAYPACGYRYGCAYRRSGKGVGIW